MANKTEDVIFRRGPAATMPQEKHSGTLLVESDTGNVFVDDSDEVRVQLTDTSKISRHGDKFENDVELDFPSETEGKSSKLSSDNINFKNGENFVKFDSNGLDGSEQVIDNIRKKLDVPNHFVWESI